MIDFLNQVNAAVVSALEGTTFYNTRVAMESTRLPEEFPCVTVEEISNTTPRRYMDSRVAEDFAHIQYRIQVFSNKSVGRREEARMILSLIDTQLTPMGLLRTSYAVVPQMYRSTIYEINCIYEGIFSKTGTVYHY